ncbi:MAG: hypothetical protein R2783_01830 [Gelidibacter sp.]
MNKLLTRSIVFLISIQLQAQDVEANIHLDVKMTEVFKDNRKFTDLAYSTHDNDGGLFILRAYKKGYYIEHYDKNIKLLDSYDFEVEKNRGAIQSAFMSGDNLCLIESLYNKDDKQMQYFINKTPKSNFSFTREPLFSVPLKEIKKQPFFSFGFGGSSEDSDIYGDFRTSKYQKYIAFTIDIKNEDSETHRLFVFNNNLEKIYQTEFTRGIKDRKFSLQNIDIDERDGTVYLLGKTYTREKKKKKEGGKYQFELFKIKGDSQKSLVFDSSENYIGSLTTVINEGKLICVGFYSEKNDSRYKGLTYFDIDPESLTMKKSVYSPFTEQFILDKYGKEKDKELRNISFRDIHITETNECILNAEEFYITSHYVSNQYGGYWRYVYNFRDIVSAKIGTDGKLTWARNINKRTAASYYSPYLSYTSTHNQGKTYFFLNCSDKVKKLRNDRLEFKGVKQKKSNFYVITLDENGSFEYKKVLDDKDSEVPFALGDGIVNNNGKDIIFQGRKGSKKQVMKVSL